MAKGRGRWLWALGAMVVMLVVGAGALVLIGKDDPANVESAETKSEESERRSDRDNSDGVGENGENEPSTSSETSTSTSASTSSTTTASVATTTPSTKTRVTGWVAVVASGFKSDTTSADTAERIARGDPNLVLIDTDDYEPGDGTPPDYLPRAGVVAAVAGPFTSFTEAEAFCGNYSGGCNVRQLVLAP